jgi:DNA-directed DNA polymerase III PolC
MKVSPHTHAESPLTGSTLATLVKSAKSLGRTHFAYTDHGHLSSALKAYNQVKKAGLKFIPGIEIYFKDTTCSLVAGTPADRCKYFTTTIYCQDQASYQELCKIVSRTDMPTMEFYEEKQQMWRWEDLEHMAKFNTQIVLSGVHCMVGKTMLAGKADIGEKVLLKLKGMFGDRLSVALLAEPWLKKFSQVVEIKYEDGTSDSILATDIVATDRARAIKAKDLCEPFSRHKHIKSKSVGMMSSEVGKDVKKATLHKGFLPLPGGDATLKVNRYLAALAARHAINVLVTDYAYYANKEDKIVQTMRLEGNNKLQPNLHMKTEDEVMSYLTTNMGFPAEKAKSIIENNEKWAKNFDDFKLTYAWRLAEVEGSQSALKKCMDIVKQNGRMRWDDPKYVERLKEELSVIHTNGVYDLTPYFLPIRDVLNHYRENGLLTGPGRGSAGGSLLCYLMGITQIDPFDFDLPFQRFFSMVRIKGKKLPDIDVDLEGRELLVGEDGHSGYLYGRWGNKAAQISTRTTIRLKSAILDTNRYFFGKVEDSIAALSKGLPTPPQGVTDHQFVFGYEDSDENHIDGLIEVNDDLKKYSETRPKEWEIVSKAMGLTRAYSKHASAFVIADVPIQDVIPTKDGNVTQYEAKEVEEAGLIKYDFLVVKQLKDIRVAMELINKKNKVKKTVGYFDHNGEELYVWKLPQDGTVYRSIWSGQTETMFQINTASMRPFVVDMLPENMMDVATLLGLVRPGPMDFIDEDTGRNMVEEYMLLRKKEIDPKIKEMYELLPETFGILVFQEQLGTIARKLAGFSGEDAELLRENMAKKKMVELLKMKPAFMEGAIKKIDQAIAEKIWEQMVTFGRYGFSVIHAVEYAHITYACMFIKHYYPLEWWAAVLTNATEQEITGKFWPFVKDIVSPPDINLSGDTMAVDYANGKLRSKLGIIRGMGEKTIDPIVNGRPYADIQDYVNKEVAGESLSHKLIHVGVLDSLFPPKSGLIEKLRFYQQSIQNKAYEEKLAKATAEGKKMRQLAPKEAIVPEDYVNIPPIKDVAMRKAVLPSLPVDLYSLGAKYSKVRDPFSDRPAVRSRQGYKTMLLNGEKLRRLDELEGLAVEEDIYVAATCFVLEAKEFAYAKNTKKALKLMLDADGYVSEKVLWPEYESGNLVYPSTLKKGAICTVFFRKKTGRKDMSITNVVVETDT